MSLETSIKREARRLGFVLAGVTTPKPPPHWQTYEHWLSMGRHASMGYLTDPRRADPLLVMPECLSILVLAFPYPNPGPLAQDLGRSHGHIAAYAGGKDYHLVLPERLNQLALYIENKVGKPLVHRGYTDTGPLLERDLAQRAGLGWIGRNTCLIHPQIGSYFLLAEILLGINLEPDPPFIADRCGKCNRCITACPTQCILSDRTIDARRCLSYQTIENRGEIPQDLRPSMGTQVFGCDICQQVCPWNRIKNKAVASPLHKEGIDPVFFANPELTIQDLAGELALGPREFNQKYKDTPILRSKRRGYLRNVAVVLGNSKDDTAIPALEKATLDNEPLIKEHAAWALDQIHKKDLR